MSKVVSGKQQEVLRIMEAISIAIAQHRLKPGMRLIEAQIVEVLKANRNHVQTALQRLALQHIVTIEPHRGAMVAQPPAREATEVFAARRVIERAIIADITPASLLCHQEEIAQQHDAEHQAMLRNDRREFVRQMSLFHIMLAKIGGNSVMTEILSNLIVRSSLIVALYQRNGTPASHCTEHDAILEALKAGDVPQAQAVMEEHLLIIEQQLDLSESANDASNLRQALSA
ncbi:GntR family transcriptional regulator [Erwinia oleae]|uniref:GntR family transcriptional regulator n=1 Tax=Erwinia oleae TaxID=796334 RepID=UPI000556AF17|nr:GntR family transcriptional regulator [Erwinia oleae]